MDLLLFVRVVAGDCQSQLACVRLFFASPFTFYFYIENAEDSLSADIDTMASSNANWTSRPSGEEMVQEDELLEILAWTDVDGVGITVNFIAHRILPCKER